MRPRTPTILLFLALGLIANVIVAWGCTLWAPVGEKQVRTVGQCPWPAPAPQGWPPMAAETTESRGFGRRMIEASSIAQGPDFWKVSDQARVMWATQSGWPAPALALRTARPTAPDDSASLQGYRVPRWLTKSHLAVHSRVPLIPIWPGFAVNTIFYGAMLWLLIRGPFILRRRLRMKREPHPLP